MDTLMNIFGSDLLLAAGNAAQRNVWRWGEPVSLLWSVIAVVAIVSFSLAIYLLEPKVKRGAAKLLLFGLRVCIFLCCIVILLNPIESKETVKVRDAYTVVVIDKSSSMTFRDRYEQGEFTTALNKVVGGNYNNLLEDNRLVRVQKALTNEQLGFFKKLREKNKIRIYSFDSDRQTLSELDQTDTAAQKIVDTDGNKKSLDSAKKLVNEDVAYNAVRKVEANGLSTVIGDSLNKIKNDLRSEKISSIIIFTDGRQNAGSLDPVEEAMNFGRRRIPIYTVGIGDPREPKDLSVDNLQAPDVSIVGDLISFDCTIKAKGYEEPVEVDVELLFNGEVKQRTRVTVGGPQPERAVRLRTKPTEPGEYKTEVKITVLATEMTAENNRATHLLRVINQRIKVLYIDGYPRWEYRYLKNALVRDRTMEAQCLLLSAEPEFPQEVTPGLRRLRRLPTRKELLEYHVVILGDVNPEAKWPSTNENVFTKEFWENMTEFVGEFGGGLLLLSGERDCPKRFKNNPLAKTLPIVIDGRTNSNARYTEIFYPKLTRLGIKSPLMRLEPDERRNMDLWRPEGRGLPGFYWYERTIKAKPLARVLAVHPSESNEHGDYPLFAWQYYKSGTVFWSAVDSTWRWRAGVGDKFTYRFYGQIIRFLSHGRFQRSKRFSITTDKTEYTIGEEVYVTARVYNRELKPSTQKEQEAEIQKPDGSPVPLTLRLIEGKPGRYEGTYRVSARGAYRATLNVGDAGADDEVAPRKFTVKLPSAELAESKMDEKGLKNIAEKSGGKFFRLSQIADIPELIQSKRERIPLSARERSLWDLKHPIEWIPPYLLGLMITLLVLEWMGRKAIRLM
jgi:hypothetical protein